MQVFDCEVSVLVAPMLTSCRVVHCDIFVRVPRVERLSGDRANHDGEEWHVSMRHKRAIFSIAGFMIDGELGRNIVLGVLSDLVPVSREITRVKCSKVV
jgi:hypothetical protein